MTERKQVNDETAAEQVARRLAEGWTVTRDVETPWTWNPPRHGFWTMDVKYLTDDERAVLDEVSGYDELPTWSTLQYDGPWGPAQSGENCRCIWRFDASGRAMFSRDDLQCSEDHTESMKKGEPVMAHKHEWHMREGLVFVVDTIPEQYPYHCDCGAFTHDPATGAPCSICAPDDHQRRSFFLPDPKTEQGE